MPQRIGIAILVIGLGVGIGWYVRAQSTADNLPNFTSGQALSAAQLNAIIEAVRQNTKALATVTRPTTIQVDCNAGDTLTAAIQNAAPGSTIEVSGTCAETVTIIQDGLTLQGDREGTTVIDGQDANVPVILVDGARRVTISQLTVQNGSTGIRARNSAAVKIQHVIAQGNSEDGIGVSRNSQAVVNNCTAQNNGDDGISAHGASHIILNGTIITIGNADDGLSVTSASGGVIDNATVTANTNGNSTKFGQETFEGTAIGDGIRVTDASSIIVTNSVIEASNNVDRGIDIGRSSTFGAFSDVDDEPVTITASGNDDDGIAVGLSSSFAVSGSNATLTTSSNGDDGLIVTSSSSFSGSNATLTTSSNGDSGLIVRISSSFSVSGGTLNVTNNTGIGCIVSRDDFGFIEGDFFISSSTTVNADVSCQQAL